MLGVATTSTHSASGTYSTRRYSETGPASAHTFCRECIAADSSSSRLAVCDKQCTEFVLFYFVRALAFEERFSVIGRGIMDSRECQGLLELRETHDWCQGLISTGYLGWELISVVEDAGNFKIEEGGEGCTVWSLRTGVTTHSLLKCENVIAENVVDWVMTSYTEEYEK